ncbi:glycosyltransferase family 4 protein [Echinicola jeungdonensis]|uniref:Glycosyltransferase family 4 protein n=1 Tax=Echinicola jeungdonensis TaxID=709343 RepID=A0ABV5JB26_9BACT|nr:glycosyltransferase family 4 protein [Echinicola jeungdonensis]MDN3670527.1 glycosyltransferase family 4 protein [Echinicola jeungdonensis]
MKVLMFGWEFPPHISGGLGTACQGIVNGLIQNNVEVIMVVPKVHGDESKENFRLVSAEDIPVPMGSSYGKQLQNVLTYFEVNNPVFPYIQPEEIFDSTSSTKSVSKMKNIPGMQSFSFSGKYGYFLFDEVRNYAFVCAQIAENNDYDLIHAHDWLSFPAALLAKRAKNKPLIIHIHSTEFDRSGEHVNQQIYDIERKAMEEADHIIAVSEFTRQIIIHRYSIHPDKITTIHNSLEKPFRINGNPNGKKFREKVICYLGRVTFQKGPEYFIEAAAKVLRKDKRFRFVMAGSGNMLIKMIELAAKLRISSHFHFTGFLKGDHVHQMLEMSDVYVMPSVSEPFGISPLEAILNQTPVIISKQSGVSEILTHAIKIDFWDTNAMANAIQALGRYQSLSKTLTQGGTKEVEIMSWVTQTEKMKSLYQSILN